MAKTIKTHLAPSPIGPYSQAVEYGDLLFLSGQIAIEPKTGNIVNESITTETHQILKNIQAVLSEAGLTMSSIIKTSIFITDMNFFAELNDEYSNWFESNFPARETVQVAGLPKGVRIEISVIAGLK
jgi:2-iminobutanoate/2-iminopropanoate deaminase